MSFIFFLFVLMILNLKKFVKITKFFTTDLLKIINFYLQNPNSIRPLIFVKQTLNIYIYKKKDSCSPNPIKRRYIGLKRGFVFCIISLNINLLFVLFCYCFRFKKYTYSFFIFVNSLFFITFLGVTRYFLFACFNKCSACIC